MISTRDIVDFGDAVILRDDRTMVVIESKGCNDDARQVAHNERYIDDYKYLEVDYGDIQNFIHQIRRLRQEDRSRGFGDLDEVLDCISEGRSL